MPERFITTPWSVVLAAADRSSPECDRALETLSRLYWYPLYALIRRRGSGPQEAEDLAQEFFARLLEKDYLEGVGPEKGRFRTFLLVCVKRFLANEHDRAAAQKRGGGRSPLSLDFRGAEDRYRLEPAHQLTPERIFERRWALTLLENVLSALERQWAESGKAELLEALRVYLVADHSGPPYAEVAERLGMTEGAVKVAVHRLRRQYCQMIQAEVGRTVGDRSEVEDEIRRLFEAVSL